VVVIKDITERKKAENELMESHRNLENIVRERTARLEELNKALMKKTGEVSHALKVKSEFLADMSHELRTPLNSIIGFSEVLFAEAYGPLNAKQKDYINYVLASGKHLLSLINDVLDMTKMEASKAELFITTLSLKNLLEQALNLVREIAFKKKIELSIEVDGRLGDIDADERKLKQIVYNLLSNAVKFTPEGGRIGIEAKMAGDFEVEIEIWDTGMGVTPENMEKIFEAFAVIKTPGMNTIEGTGLGLALSRKLVELHGGRLWAESKGPGRGARFRVILPVRAVKKAKDGRSAQ